MAVNLHKKLLPSYYLSEPPSKREFLSFRAIFYALPSAWGDTFAFAFKRALGKVDLLPASGALVRPIEFI
jgi:hypothetical protein